LQFEPQKIEALPDPSALNSHARQGLAGLDERLAHAGEELKEVIEIPWFQPTLKISRRRLTSFCGCKKDSQRRVGSERWN